MQKNSKYIWLNLILVVQAVFILMFATALKTDTISISSLFFIFISFLYMVLAYDMVIRFSEMSKILKHIVILYSLTAFYILSLLLQIDALYFLITYTLFVTGYTFIMSIALCLQRDGKGFIDIPILVLTVICILIYVFVHISFDYTKEIYLFLVMTSLLSPLVISIIFWSREGKTNLFGRKKLVVFSCISFIIFVLIKLKDYLLIEFLHYYYLLIYFTFCYIYIYTAVLNIKKSDIINDSRGFLSTIISKRFFNTLDYVIMLFLIGIGYLLIGSLYSLPIIFMLIIFFMEFIRAKREHVKDKILDDRDELKAILTIKAMEMSIENEKPLLRFLHNEVQQDMIFLKMELLNRRDFPEESEAIKILDNTIANIRGLTSKERLPLSNRIKQIIKNAAVYWDDRILIDYYGSGEDELKSPYDEIAYNIIKELVNNIYKYAGGNLVELTVKVEGSELVIESQNDIADTDRSDTRRGGAGLEDTKELVTKLDGVMEIENSGNFIVSIMIPLRGELSFEDFINRRP